VAAWEAACRSHLQCVNTRAPHGPEARYNALLQRTWPEGLNLCGWTEFGICAAAVAIESASHRHHAASLSSRKSSHWRIGAHPAASGRVGNDSACVWLLNIPCGRHSNGPRPNPRRWHRALPCSHSNSRCGAHSMRRLQWRSSMHHHPACRQLLPSNTSNAQSWGLTRCALPGALLGTWCDLRVHAGAARQLGRAGRGAA
jgi:hypothetical protein